jgi:hypothetical protein
MWESREFRTGIANINEEPKNDQLLAAGDSSAPHAGDEAKAAK